MLLPLAHATNFLVVVLDDLGADKVGAYEAEFYATDPAAWLPSTPAIDQLAAAGLRFSTAYANPVCTPSRASLLTGRYPFEHDVSAIISPASPELDVEEATLPELLREEGYATALFGKWHLGSTTPGGSSWAAAGEVAEAPAPALHGFEAYAGSLEGEVDDYYDWLEARWPVTLSTGEEGSVLAERTTWASDVPGEDLATWTLTQPGPWFVMVSLNAPHSDTEGSEDIWEEDDFAPETSSCLDLNGDGACANREAFATLAEDADRRVGWLLEDLYASDPVALDDLLVVLVGDNGTPIDVLEAAWLPSGDRGDAGKSTSYETGLRVPFILTRGCDWLDLRDGSLDGWAGGAAACTATSLDLVAPGRTVDRPVQVEDVYATIAEVLGREEASPAASVSVLPCLADTAADCGLGARHVYGERFSRPYAESNDYGREGPAGAGYLGLRDARWKLVGHILEAEDTGTDACITYEMYDLTADPYEVEDLYDGRALDAAQEAGWTGLWEAFRLEIGPDWLPPRTCEVESPWDADGDRFEAVGYGGRDCDDGDAAVNPDAAETWYDGVDSSCSGNDYDQDGDGYVVRAYGGDDCNDRNAQVYPGRTEVWYNGIDQDCDGADDYDQDGDGARAASSGGGDCVDTDAGVYPGAAEIAGDGVDQDCDGVDPPGDTGGVDTASSADDTAVGDSSAGDTGDTASNPGDSDTGAVDTHLGDTAETSLGETGWESDGDTADPVDTDPGVDTDTGVDTGDSDTAAETDTSDSQPDTDETADTGETDTGETADTDETADTGETDTGDTDTGETDTGDTDTGDTDTGETDTGDTDTGDTDTGETDTGDTDTGETDTGETDTGDTDTGDTDTGDTDTADTDTADTHTGGTDTADTDDTATKAPPPCGCGHAGASPALGLLALAGLRRRHSWRDGSGSRM